jgi:ribosomal protein L11 methyltransferase
VFGGHLPLFALQYVRIEHFREDFGARLCAKHQPQRVDIQTRLVLCGRAAAGSATTAALLWLRLRRAVISAIFAANEEPLFRMKADSLWHVSVSTSAEAEEAVAALLERLFGEPASIYVEEQTQARTAGIYFPKSNALSKREALAAGLTYIEDCGLKLGPAKISMHKVRREDWSESWKKFFKTIEIGSALLIKPTWSKRRPRRNQAAVVLDPGLSFGTGQHATTSFCLKQLVACKRPGEKQSFLDIGTGSGVLAISAAKLAYQPVRAIDYDPVAVRVAKTNARRNRVHGRISITRNDLTRWPARSETRYDLICATLIDSLLIDESARILNRLKPGGRLVLAGILASQFANVQESYEALGLKLVLSDVEREWQSGLFEYRIP